MTQPKLLDCVRSVARLRHLSLSTERTYSDWIKRFILYHGKRHPSEMGSEQIRQFLSHLAVDGRVSASTQNQALCALLFLYRDVLQIDLPYVEGIERAKRPARVPVVFTRQEVGKLLARLTGTYYLIASLLYGSGLRLMEGLRLRVKDLDFDYGQITVRAGKGEKDRRTVLPRPLGEPLRQQLARVRLLHEQDLSEGHGAVHLPYALERKYPNAAREWVRRFSETAKRHKLPHAVVLPPTLGGDFASVPARLKADDIPSVDLSSLRDEFTPERFRATKFDSHPSAMVHRRLGELLAEYVLERRLTGARR